jgi:hypothetical protein
MFNDVLPSANIHEICNGNFSLNGELCMFQEEESENQFSICTRELSNDARSPNQVRLPLVRNNLSMSTR